MPKYENVRQKLRADRMPAASLTDIPGVGPSTAKDLRAIGIYRIDDLVGKDPELLYDLSNNRAGKIQDRCLLYVFRCAVYFAETPEDALDPKKLKWWYWKDGQDVNGSEDAAAYGRPR